MKHRKFTDLFKRNAVNQALKRGVNKSALAKDLEISGNLLHRWIRESSITSEAGGVKTGKFSQMKKTASTKTSTSAPSSGDRGAELLNELKALNSETALLLEAVNYYYADRTGKTAGKKQATA